MRHPVSPMIATRFTTGFGSGRRMPATLAAVAPAGSRYSQVVFVKMEGWYFRLWCDDEQLRVEGLLNLADMHFRSRSRIDPDTAARRLASFSRQTGFGPLQPTEIARLARNAGLNQLAEQLYKLSATP